MMITKQTVADQIAAYLHHEITLPQLVDWAENAMMDGEFAERDATTISSVIARLGVADVRTFGLAWKSSPHKPTPVFDKIDTALTWHYEFTVEELDSILNYDIKYCLGRGTETEAKD